MKYIVIPPNGYKAESGESLEFGTHKEAVKCALAISRKIGASVEIQRYPIPYKSKELVINA